MTNPDTSTSGDDVGRDKYEGEISISGGISGTGNAIGQGAESHTHYHNQAAPQTVLLSWLSQRVRNNIAPKDLHTLAKYLLDCPACPYDSLNTYNSLEELISFLFHHEQNQNTKQQLISTFERIFGYELPFVHLATLIELVPEIDLEAGTLRDVYRRSAPDGPRWGLLDIQKTDELLEHIIYRLAQARRQHDGTYPLMTFISRLAGLIDRHNSTCASLEQWLHTSGEMLGVEAGSSVAALYKEQTGQEEISLVYLLVRLKPEGDKGYFVTAWLGKHLRSDQNTHQNHHTWQPRQIYADQDGQIWKIHEIPRIFKSILRLAQQEIQTSEELHIEIFLPIELLDYANDHWFIPRGTSGFHLGRRYNVYTRSYDRIYPPEPEEMAEANRDWMKRWQTWKEALNSKLVVNPEWIDSERECNFDKVMSDSSISFLAFSFALSSRLPKDERINIYWNLLYTGVPVAILPRNQVLDTPSLKQKFQMMSQAGCARLPMSVREVRREAFNTNQHQSEEESSLTHYGYHLTLLWDDPERLPPDGILY